MRKIISSILFGICPILSWGQDSLKTTILQELIFSASRTEQPVAEVPRSASIISREALEKSMYLSVGELLQSQEGIYVVGATQTPGSNQSAFLRGANSNQYVVMVDGVRITDPSSPNGAIDLSEISVANVERIEIIRGSHTSVYGGAAIGGVINIITRNQQATGFNGYAALRGGSLSQDSYSVNAQADLNYSFKKGAYVNASIWQQHVSGLDATIKQPEAGFTTADKDGFSKIDASLKAGVHRNKLDAFVSYKKTNQQADIDAGAFDDDENYTLDFDRDLINYQAQYKLASKWSVLLNGSWSESVRVSLNDSSLVNENGDTDRSYFKGNYTGRLFTQEVQGNYNSEKMEVVFGGGVFYEKMFFDTYYFSKAFGLYESITNYDTINSRTHTFYEFAKATYYFNQLSVTGGLRFSQHSMFGSAGTFEFSPAYTILNNIVYVSVSSGYNAPSLYQLFDPTQGWGTVVTRGNNKLEAEKSLSLEAGLKHSFQNGSHVTLSAFQTSVNNSIEYIYLWNGETPVDELGYADHKGDTYVNLAQQLVRGVDLNAQINIVKKLSTQGNISLMKGEVTSNPDDVDQSIAQGNHIQLYNTGAFLSEEVTNKNLVRRPQVMVNWLVTYKPMERLSLQAGYRFTGSRYDNAYDYSLGPYGALNQVEIANYHLFDFNAQWKWTDNLLTTLKVENITDRAFQEIQGFQTRGRSIYLGLVATW